MPYIFEGAAKSRLKGHTQADAVVLDEETGCAAVFEAKALSDTEYQVKYNTLRNQLVRNIDCMLEPNRTCQSRCRTATRSGRSSFS